MSELDQYPLLSGLLALPLLGALITVLLRDAAWVRRVALATALLTLLVSLLVIVAFDGAQRGFQLIDSAPWMPGINIRYLVGIDGLSLLFLPATALLFCGAVIAGWRSVQGAPGLYFALLLMFEAATLGVFCALDSMLFFFCWELTLLPLYFLVSLWGVGGWRQTAAVRYFFVMLGGGVPLLFGILLLAFGHAAGGPLVFDLPTLLANPLPKDAQYLIFLLLLVGFGVKVPLIPLHTWLPAIAMGAPAAVTALLVGLKLGAYGLIRFVIPLAPAAAQDLHWLLAGLGTVAILYGAVAALAQSNLRGVLAYLSLSHVGLVLLGLASFSVSALQGAVLQLLNFSMAASGGFLMLAFLQRRTGSTAIAHLGGVAHSMPLLTSFFLIFGLAGLGVPGTSGFPAELLIIVAALHTHTGAGLAALFAVVVGAGAFLMPFRNAFLGPVRQANVAAAEDLQARELFVALVPTVLLLVFGFYPAPLLELLRPAAEAWVAGVRVF
jgi:NADH-quinone oxidoreductase subunit M